MQEEGRRMQEVGRAQAAQAQANMAALTVQTQNGLQGMADALLRMKEMPKAKGDPATLAVIDALRDKILVYKDNLPTDAALRQKNMEALKVEAMTLMQRMK